MNNQGKPIKTLRFWNMILVIFGGLGGVIGIMGLPALLDSTKQLQQVNESISKVSDPALIKTMEQSLALMITPLYRGYSLLILVLSLVILTAFVQNLNKLRQGLPLVMWPYYLHLSKIVLAVIVSLLVGGVSLNGSLFLSTIILNCCWAIPAVLIILKVNQMKNQQPLS